MHILPTRKLSQPSLLCFVAYCRNRVGGPQSISVTLPCTSRYFSRTLHSARSVSSFSNQSMSSSTDAVSILRRPLSWHLVMCCVDSFLHPQLGQIFFTFSLHLAKCLFVPLKCDVCFVSHFLYMVGNFVIVLSIPSHQILSKSCLSILCFL